MRLFVFGRRFDDRQETGSSRVLSLALRLAINAAALGMAARLVPGIEIQGRGSLVAAAAIFGVVNALIKPLAHVVGCPLTCLTLGLFALIINAAMLALTAWIAGALGLAVQVDGFWAVLWGALLIGIVSAILTAFVGWPLRLAFRRGRR